MSTFDLDRLEVPRLPVRRALEIAALALLLGFGPEWLRARTGYLPEPHPAWLCVLLLAARHGSLGCLAGLAAAGGAVVLGSWAGGDGPAAAFAHISSGPELVAFAACLVVSWIASWHLRREGDLELRLRGSAVRQRMAEETIESLRAVTARLRERVDRAANSLTLLRDSASRLEGRDPIAAAEGAADLALARTGAAAAAVRVGADGFHRLLAVRDARGPAGLDPLELRSADLTVPIRIRNEAIGAIVLWGLPPAGIDEATAHDLSVISSWCAPALALGAPRLEALLESGRRAS